MRRLLLITIALLMTGCGTSSQSEQQTSEVLGKPPGPEDDPFFYVARPPPETEASTKGTIGDEEQSSADESLDVDELREELERARTEAVDLQTQNLELKNRLAEAEANATKPEPEPEPKSDRAQCHSCVRLCPAKGRCADDAELICGWGTGDRRRDAKRRARAECDGALQAVREDGPWSRIEGTCPVASCSR